MQTAKSIKPVHPFPARMAPDLAIRELSNFPAGIRVLDPMSGSGTVVRHAVAQGHSAIGRDLDPLAVLMTRVWNTPFDSAILERRLKTVLRRARELPSTFNVPWIDEDEETKTFINYWFGAKQQDPLRRIASVMANITRHNRTKDAELDILRVALSRIIVTKDQGASLARDTSHSRPHRVDLTSDFDVWAAFERSVQRIRTILEAAPSFGDVDVAIGDARSLDIANASVDVVLTSPPYLNAIDYMRGHRMSLVWLGHKLSELREIRSSSIGAERGPDKGTLTELFADIQQGMCDFTKLSERHKAMIVRYSEDLYRMMSEISRVLKPKGRAILVVGNSCLKGTFVKNSQGVVLAGTMVGLRLEQKLERDLPDQHRYLPMPPETDAPLGRRMRTESILTFSPA